MTRARRCRQPRCAGARLGELGAGFTFIRRSRGRITPPVRSSSYMQPGSSFGHGQAAASRALRLRAPGQRAPAARWVSSLEYRMVEFCYFSNGACRRCWFLRSTFVKEKEGNLIVIFITIFCWNNVHGDLPGRLRYIFAARFGNLAAPGRRPNAITCSGPPPRSGRGRGTAPRGAARTWLAQLAWPTGFCVLRCTACQVLHRRRPRAWQQPATAAGPPHARGVGFSSRQ